MQSGAMDRERGTNIFDAAKSLDCRSPFGLAQNGELKPLRHSNFPHTGQTVADHSYSFGWQVRVRGYSGSSQHRKQGSDDEFSQEGSRSQGTLAASASATMRAASAGSM